MARTGPKSPLGHKPKSSPPREPGAATSRKPKAAQGMPLSLIVPGKSAEDWLAQIELRTGLLLELRPELATNADAAEAIRLAALARSAIDARDVEGAAWAAMLAISAAWAVELKVGAMPMLLRDRTLQDSKRNPRHPEIDDWIAGKIRRHPDSTALELWAMRPDWIEDAIGLDRFRKRLTRVRAGRM